MDSQAYNSDFARPVPAPHINNRRTFQHGFDPNNGGSAYAHRNAAPSPASHTDPYTRIAILEKELEHCKVEKATAELAVQYLATLSARGATHGANRDDRLAKLMSELMRANQDNLGLKAKLENTQNILTTLLTSGSLAPLHMLTSTGQKNPQQTGPIENVDLIDLLGTSKASENGKLTEDGTTLLETSYDEFSDDGHGVQVAIKAEQRDQLESTAFADSAYIHHFVPKANGVHVQSDGSARRASQKIEGDPTNTKNAVTSFDQCSETSVEPKSDESFHECSASSEGPASSSSSFVTANAEEASQGAPLVESVAENAADTQTLGVQGTDLPGPFAPATSPGRPNDQWVEEIVPCGKQQSTFASAKVSLGPTLKTPSWKVSRVFPSNPQHERVVACHKRDIRPAENRYPELFRYGLRFDPDDDERDIYRTILIFNIPADATMHQVLEKVRGGRIVDAKLLDTIKMIGSQSALVIFLHEHAALGYEEYAKSHPITINNSLAKVKVLSTPTWPIYPGLRTAIDDYQHTRCLEVHNFPRRQISEAKLRTDLRVCAQMKGDRIEYLKLRGDGILELHFTSIDHAGQGFGMFTTFKLYKGCKAYFVADPCAQPVETLDEKEATVDLDTQTLNRKSTPLGQESETPT